MVSAPILTSPTSGSLDWTYSDTEPASWNVWDAAGPTLVDNVPAGSRSDSGFSSGDSYYLQGVDSLGNPFTPVSNTVVCM